MNVIDKLVGIISQFNEGMQNGSLMQDICKEYEAEICDMNTEDQLFEQGLNRVGVPIMDYAPYQPKTIEIKQIKRQPYNRVTLRDSGDFHYAWFIEFDDKGFKLGSKDYKAEWLEKKYGRQIFGLTDENAKELATSYIQPDLINKLKSMIQNG